MTIEKKLFTSKETMAYLNLGKNSFYNLVDLGILRNVSLDSNLRFDKTDLDSLIETLKNTTITKLIEDKKEK
jgi:hypothetical protein